MKANNFDVLKTMAERGMTELKSYPLTNVMQVDRGSEKKQWGHIKIAIDSATAGQLLVSMMGDNPTHNVYLLVFDIRAFRKIREELEQQPAVREALADYAHHAWSGWMDYLFSKGIFHDDGTWTMPKEFADRWRRQASAAYVDLPESEKKSDREEADKMLAILGCYDNTPDKE